jgi:type 1 glutamine amidotransferase
MCLVTGSDGDYALLQVEKYAANSINFTHNNFQGDLDSAYLHKIYYMHVDSQITFLVTQCRFSSLHEEQDMVARNGLIKAATCCRSQ